ncbi:MAG: hypothetical protein HY287_11150 [Planctomycetes bacterium]|nr:hypothetical protein [Planctomycetota bacterium]
MSESLQIDIPLVAVGVTMKQIRRAGFRIKWSIALGGGGLNSAGALVWRAHATEEVGAKVPFDGVAGQA